MFVKGRGAAFQYLQNMYVDGEVMSALINRERYASLIVLLYLYPDITLSREWMGEITDKQKKLKR